MRARVCLRLSAALSLHRDSPCSVTRRGLRDPNNKQGQQDEPVMVDGSAASTPTFARAASQPCLSACQWLSLSLLGRRRGGWESEDEREREDGGQVSQRRRRLSQHRCRFHCLCCSIEAAAALKAECEKADSTAALKRRRRDASVAVLDASP